MLGLILLFEQKRLAIKQRKEVVTSSGRLDSRVGAVCSLHREQGKKGAGIRRNFPGR